MCCSKTLDVGGQFSIDLDIFVNRYFRHSLTFEYFVPRSYITQTNLSKISLSISCMSVKEDSRMKVSVVSVSVCYVFHIVFFALPANCDVVSEPVNAWKNGRAMHTFWPRTSAYLWIGIQFLSFPTPNSIHSSWSCFSLFKVKNTEREITTTSESTVTTFIFLYSSKTSLTWMKIRVYASSCLQGEIFSWE